MSGFEGVAVDEMTRPVTTDEVRELARRIQAEIAWSCPTRGGRIGGLVRDWIADPAARQWHLTFGARRYQRRLREMRTSHQARLVLLRLAVTQAYRDDPDDERPDKARPR